MYCIIIGVPFRRVGPGASEVPSDWGKALLLLRDSLNGRFGPLTVAAPEWVAPGLIAEQAPMRLDAATDQIDFVSLGRIDWRARTFWKNYKNIRAKCDELVAGAEVVHTGINDIWQPYSVIGFWAGLRAGKTTVFVLDTDLGIQMEQLTRGASLADRMRAKIFSFAWYHVSKKPIELADLPLLKGRALHERFGQFSSRAKDFYNTSYSAADLIPADALDAKCAAALDPSTPIRTVSFGRLSPRKGIDHTIRAVAEAASQGVPVTLDIIGGGSQEADLRRLVDELTAGAFIKFTGQRKYGPELMAELQSFHVALFNPLGEDTPRAVFDAMAAGQALLAYDIPFMREVLVKAGQPAPVPIGDVAGTARQIRELHDDRPRLAALLRASAAAGADNTAEMWYARRAQWTFEAWEEHARRRAQPKSPAAVPAGEGV